MQLNIIDNSLPKHLGGHENMTHIDEGVLNLFINKFGINSYLDIGCGPGGMVELAHSKKLLAVGIDGDYSIKRSDDHHFVIHDYSKGVVPNESVDNWVNNGIFDLGYSCEFLEHVEERYMDNYMDSFLKCKRLVVTHGLPGQPGHHHVNKQEFSYWFHNFGVRGFLFDMKTTNEVRNASTMAQRFMRNTGLVFFNSNLNWQVV
jgi:cyclopropane fatty-acyl-phospholipid synthase-like methyltransferase